MNRKEVEQAMMQKLEESVELYHQYNASGEYLAMTYVGGTFYINNAYYDTDGAKPVDTFRNAKCDIVDGHVVHREDVE